MKTRIKKIFVAGNPLLKIDSMPLLIRPALAKRFPKICFEEFDPTENFPQTNNFTVIDTVVGIKKAEILLDTNRFVLSKAYSLHDFDLALNLKLMQKAGMIKKFKIIGVPPHLSEKEALKQVSKIIKSSSL